MRGEVSEERSLKGDEERGAWRRETHAVRRGAKPRPQRSLERSTRAAHSRRGGVNE